MGVQLHFNEEWKGAMNVKYDFADDDILQLQLEVECFAKTGAQMAEEAKMDIAKENEETERLKLQYADEQKLREMKNKQYEREHAVFIQQMKEDAAERAAEQEAELHRQNEYYRLCFFVLC